MNRRKANSSIRKSAAATGHATMADPQMANKHTKCSTALAVREPQIKVTVRLCYTLTTRPCYALTTSVSKRRDNSKCWRATEKACSARCPADGSRKWRSHSEKQPGILLKTCNCHTTKQLHVGVFVPEKRKFILHTKTTMGIFTEALLVIAKKTRYKQMSSRGGW